MSMYLYMIIGTFLAKTKLLQIPVHKLFVKRLIVATIEAKVQQVGRTSKER